MRFGIRFVVLLLSAVEGVPADAVETRPWAPYVEVHSVYAKFLNIPVSDRNRLVFHLDVKPPSGVSTPNDIRLTLLSNGVARRIPIDGGWRMQFPLEDRLLRENPMIRTNLPQGTPLVLRPQLAIAPLPGREWSIAELARALRQANAAVRAQAGMFAWFGPKATSVLFRFSDPSASLRIEDGRTSRNLPANEDGDVEILLDGATVKSNARLQMSTVPRDVLPRFPITMTLTVDADSR